MNYNFGIKKKQIWTSKIKFHFYYLFFSRLSMNKIFRYLYYKKKKQKSSNLQIIIRNESMRRIKPAALSPNIRGSGSLNVGQAANVHARISLFMYRKPSLNVLEIQSSPLLILTWCTRAYVSYFATRSDDQFHRVPGGGRDVPPLFMRFACRGYTDYIFID